MATWASGRGGGGVLPLWRSGSTAKLPPLFITFEKNPYSFFEYLFYTFFYIYVVGWGGGGLPALLLRDPLVSFLNTPFYYMFKKILIHLFIFLFFVFFFFLGGGGEGGGTFNPPPSEISLSHFKVIHKSDCNCFTKHLMQWIQCISHHGAKTSIGSKKNPKEVWGQE